MNHNVNLLYFGTGSFTGRSLCVFIQDVRLNSKHSNDCPSILRLPLLSDSGYHWKGAQDLMERFRSYRGRIFPYR